MKKAYVQYYDTFENVLERLHDIEERECVRKLTIQYGLHGTAPESFNTEALEIAWTICKDLIDQQIHRREVNAANRAGKKSAPATTEENTTVVQPEEKPAQEIQPEEPKRQNFVKPTVEEIAAYCSESKNGIDPQAFYDFYESKGWKVGAVKMKDWRASVRTWEQRCKTEQTGGRNKAGGMWGNENEIPDEITDLF